MNEFTRVSLKKPPMATPAPIPAGTTAPPVPTPVATTAPPVTLAPTPPATTTAPPLATTPAPTTAAPVATPPVATTGGPTLAPISTTAAPQTLAPGTATPVPTTGSPFVTPSSSTAAPNTPSPSNVFTTPSPVSSAPFSTPLTPSVTPPALSSNSGTTLSTGVIIGIIAGGSAIAVILLIFLLWCCCAPAKKKRPYSPDRRQSQAALLKAPAQNNGHQGYGPSQTAQGDNAGPSRTLPRENFGPPKPAPRQPVPVPIRELREERGYQNQQGYPNQQGYKNQQGYPNQQAFQNEPGSKNPRQQWNPPPPPVVAPSPKLPSEPKSQPESPAMETVLQAPPRPPSAFADSHRMFTWEELKQATNNFAPENLLGQGGFGKVYKGVTSKGVMIAVKQLTLGGMGGQGEREFKSEVEVISRVHHRHLVTLLGYCMKGEERLLVLEYMANGTLESNLHGKNKPVMDWASRKKVAIGAARGLAYLHEDCHPRIIHRDIKASNILMDEHFDAQVADFGLAKLAEEKDTHVTTRVMGTFGYLAPEYAMSGKLTEKSDVFSFGVVLLELISGRRPVDMTQPPGQESLVEWARPILMQERYTDLVDPRLKAAGYDPDEMNRFIRAAMLCIRSTATKRPRMTQVVRMLEDDGLSPDSTAGNYRPTQRFDSIPFGGGPYMSSEFGSEPNTSGEYSQASQGHPSGPAQGRAGASLRSGVSGGAPSAEVALDVFDEQRGPQAEDNQYGNVSSQEDLETGSVTGQPAQVQLAQWRPTTPGSSLPPPPGRHSRQGSLTPPSQAALRPPPGRSPTNQSGYGQAPPRRSRGSSRDFDEMSPSSSNSAYTSGQMGSSAYVGNTVLMPERFDGEGR